MLILHIPLSSLPVKIAVISLSESAPLIRPVEQQAGTDTRDGVRNFRDPVEPSPVPTASEGADWIGGLMTPKLGQNPRDDHPPRTSKAAGSRSWAGKERRSGIPEGACSAAMAESTRRFCGNCMPNQGCFNMGNLERHAEADVTRARSWSVSCQERHGSRKGVGAHAGLWCIACRVSLMRDFFQRPPDAELAGWEVCCPSVLDE